MQFKAREYNHATYRLHPTMENVVTLRHRVLAVEDDADTLQLMRMVLSDLPLDIIHAGTGAEEFVGIPAGVFGNSASQTAR